ncbi:hypothetical protein GOBAR_AA39707 [Gossypium barbadense]|uniref:CCHC-type domain-containing protein n=1 Tax=Gossypium barbadense TaxID=3634 RepID=A0A2P5VQF5_GOSBA|nr:hypothetical protein GOBAR_AA39707 [Gossypium barbadense]
MSAGSEPDKDLEAKLMGVGEGWWGSRRGMGEQKGTKQIKREMAANQSERQSEEQRGNTAITVTTTPPTLTPLVETKLKSACFKCKKQGHWAKDCPSNDNPTAKPSSPPLDTHLIPVLCCHCGVACTIHVSRSDANYGRPYYSRNCTCDKATRGRNFYKWCDDVKAPMCSCGAGACTVNNRRDENGKETKYFTCRIRTGHGACGFLQFESPTSSRPRSMEIDERPSTMRLRRGGLSDITTHEISVTGNSPNGCRIEFSPTQILKEELRQLRYVSFASSLLSSSMMPSVIADAEVDKVSQNALSQNALGSGTQPLCDPLGTSSLETSFIASEKGVNDTFDASVSPLIECRSFAEHVVESFRGISIVAGMESTLKDNCNQSVPSTLAIIIFGQSMKELLILKTHCQIEKLETYLLKTAKDVGQLKRYMQATNQELTKALKLTQEKEEQMHFNKDNIK